MKCVAALAIMLASAISVRADGPFKPVFTAWQAGEPPVEATSPPVIKLVCFSTDPSRPQVYFPVGKMVHCKATGQGEIKKWKFKIRPDVPVEDKVTVSDTECMFVSPVVGYYEIEVTAVDVNYEIAATQCRIEIGARQSEPAASASTQFEQRPAPRAVASATSGPEAAAAVRTQPVRREAPTYDPDVLVAQWASEVQTDNRAFEAGTLSKHFKDSATIANAMATSRAFIGSDAARAWKPFYDKVSKLYQQMNGDLKAAGMKPMSEPTFTGHVAKALESVQ